jgi:hypothetical protein
MRELELTDQQSIVDGGVIGVHWSLTRFDLLLVSQ